MMSLYLQASYIDIDKNKVVFVNCLNAVYIICCYFFHAKERICMVLRSKNKENARAKAESIMQVHYIHHIWTFLLFELINYKLRLKGVRLAKGDRQFRMNPCINIPISKTCLQKCSYSTYEEDSADKFSSNYRIIYTQFWRHQYWQRHCCTEHG